MKTLAIIGFAVGTVLAGCASTSGAASKPTSSAAVPTQENDQRDGDQAGMMAGMCPMKVLGTTVAATETAGGIDLSFATTTGDVAELRQRTRRMAKMHNKMHSKPGGHKMMGRHGAHAKNADAEPKQGAHAGKGGGHGGKKMSGKKMSGKKMIPASIASVEDITGGARLILQPADPGQLGALREHVRMKSARMAGGECPMMSRGSGGEPAPPTAGDADSRNPGQ